MIPEPDFERLGRATPWTADTWRAAWDTLYDKRNWPMVMDVVQHGIFNDNPISAADALNRITERTLEADFDRLRAAWRGMWTPVVRWIRSVVDKMARW